MINKYIRHVQSKSPHERRGHAVVVAGTLTALAAIVWITTLSVRFATPPSQGGVAGGNVDQTQLAGAAGSDFTQQTGIQVVGTSTETSDFSDYSDTNVTQ